MSELAGKFIETDLSPERLQAAVVVGDDQRYAFSRKAFKRLLYAPILYTYTKCARCGDERMAPESVVDQEIDHAVAGCNGPLYQFDPTATP